MEERMPLGPMLAVVSHLARERLEARLNRYEVTPTQIQALMYLHKNGGQALQRELADFLKVKPSTANGIVDRMVEKGLAVRSVSGSDARHRLVSLTEKGRERQNLFLQNFQESERLLVKGLTAEEAETLRALLGRVIANLEEDRTSC